MFVHPVVVLNSRRKLVEHYDLQVAISTWDLEDATHALPVDSAVYLY
jgi:hypothetical protein